MKYILIVMLLTSSGNSQLAIEFNNQAACEQALATIPKAPPVFFAKCLVKGPI